MRLPRVLNVHDADAERLSTAQLPTRHVLKRLPRFSDYVLPDDANEDVVDRVTTVLDVPIASTAELETREQLPASAKAAPTKAAPAKAAAPPDGAAAAGGQQAAVVRPSPLLLVGAVAAALLALLAGWWATR